MGVFSYMLDKKEVLKNFQEIPGVGVRIAEDLWDLGFRKISGLRGKDPQKLYDKPYHNQLPRSSAAA